MHSQVNRRHYDTVRAYPGDVDGELHPGVMPGHVDQFGVAVNLRVPRTPGGRAVGLLVIVPGPDRDSEHHASWHPARADELGEILAGQFGTDGCGGAGAPAPRTAVPIAWNSSPPDTNSPEVSDTPTTPCPPSAAHSAVIRSIALRLASYIASTSGRTPRPPSPDTRVIALAGPVSLLDQPPAQPKAPV
jgi:hypothetical protein